LNWPTNCSKGYSSTNQLISKKGNEFGPKAALATITATRLVVVPDICVNLGIKCKFKKNYQPQTTSQFARLEPNTSCLGYNFFTTTYAAHIPIVGILPMLV